MVDAVRLARLLQRVGEQLSRLRAHAAGDRAALRGDELRLSAAGGLVVRLPFAHPSPSGRQGPAACAAN